MLAVVALLAGCGGDDGEEAAPTVFAASSLREVAPEIDPDATVVFGGSNNLATQIRDGARADVILSASREAGGGSPGRRAGRGAGRLRLQPARRDRPREEPRKGVPPRRPRPRRRQARARRGGSACRRLRPRVARAGRARRGARQRRQPRGRREGRRRQGRARRGRCRSGVCDGRPCRRRRRALVQDLGLLPARDRLLRGARLAGLRGRSRLPRATCSARTGRRRFERQASVPRRNEPALSARARHGALGRSRLPASFPCSRSSCACRWAS